MLKKLWSDGLSASQIAGQIGGGVTRNAVIGKVHRLKLSARAKPASPSQRSNRTAARQPRRPSQQSSQSAAAMKRRMIQNAPRTAGATALSPSSQIERELYLAPQEQELEIPAAERLSLLQLTEETCKWPIGDPTNPEFHFCGRGSLDGKPYCEFHSARAYHQQDRRRR